MNAPHSPTMEFLIAVLCLAVALLVTIGALGLLLTYVAEPLIEWDWKRRHQITPDTTTFGGWRLCPVCGGSKSVFQPGPSGGCDVPDYKSHRFRTCRRCAGRGRVPNRSPK